MLFSLGEPGRRLRVLFYLLPGKGVRLLPTEDEDMAIMKRFDDRRRVGMDVFYRHRLPIWAFVADT